MKTQKLLLIILTTFISVKSYTQDYQIPPPECVFDGTRLTISYQVTNFKQSDQLYVWVEIENKKGEKFQVKSLFGDVGESIIPGPDKTITWIPENDSVFLNEMVYITVKAEKYNKSFNKGSAMMLSAALPGLGQTKISGGKPWWLIGIASYGCLAGGFISHAKYLDTYDTYKSELDPQQRADLLAKAQKEQNLSSTLFITGAAMWAASFIWTALTPNDYQPLQNISLSLEKPAPQIANGPLLTLRFNF